MHLALLIKIRKLTRSAPAWAYTRCQVTGGARETHLALFDDVKVGSFPIGTVSSGAHPIAPIGSTVVIYEMCLEPGGSTAPVSRHVSCQVGGHVLPPPI